MRRFPYGGFRYTVTVKKDAAQPAAAVARIGATLYASLREAIKAVRTGETIELLQSLDLGSGVVQLEENDKDFTIDLKDNTLKANAQCLVYMTEGSGHVTIRNGTLNGSSCASQTIFVRNYSSGSPRLTLTNVTATAGTSGLPVVQVVANGTVEFDGGTYTGGVRIEAAGNAVLKSGTFAKGGNSYSIQTTVDGKTLPDYLDGESLFWKEGALLDLSGATETGDAVTVGPCTHTWDNGTCTICAKVCDHGAAEDGSMATATCSTCKMTAAAEVETATSDKYFLSFDSALVCATQNEGCTLRLLANVVDVTVTTEKPFIFDLNGHTVHRLTVNSKITLKDSSGGSGQIVENLIVEVKGMSVGELLEEGYAFRSCLDGSWPVATVQTVGNVSILPAPIKSVTAENPSVTVEYGKTAEVTLKATVVPSAEGGTVSYQWYKIGGTDFPIQDATENTYQLPADLGAGTHTYRLTATSDGYPKSVDITVKVTPISLEGATVTVKDLTYNGQKQFPTVTVKLGETTLTKNTDFYVDATMQTNAGSYTLTISGNGNYSGKIKNVEWKIEPIKIDHVEVSSDISKTYDGTAAVTKTAEEWAKVLTFKTLSAYDVVSVPSDAYTISDAYFVEKSGEETFHSPDAGEKYGISFKITLKSNNYVLQTYDEDTPSTSKEITQSGGANFTIKQAAVTSPAEITQLVFNDLAKTYTLDLAALLPKLSEDCAYGSIQYQGHNYNFTDSTYLDSNNGMSVSKEGILTLPTVSAHTSDVNTQIGTITVPVVTTNYQNFEFTIKVVISARIPLNASGVIVSASDITYGQTLNESKLTATGTMKHPGTGEEVKGTFAWKNGTVKPDASDSYEAEWTFTPAAGYEEYAPATGTVTVKVKPAKLTVSVKASRTYYTGEAQIASIIASGQSVDSTPVTFTYSDKVDGNYTSDGPTFTDAGTYTAYYKAEAANHEPATGTFTVTIDPLPISLLSVSSISKTYDGTASVMLSTDMLTFISKTAKATNIKLPDTAITFTNAQFTKKQADGSYLPSPEVGGGKALSFTMTLISNNYVFEGRSKGTTEVSDVFATDDANRFAIIKAKAPAAEAGALTITNGLEKTYSFDLSALLPKLTAPCEYGSVSYSVKGTYLTDGYKDTVKAEIVEENGQYKLKLTVPAVDYDRESSVGTLDIKVVSDNYQDFTLTIGVKAKNKTVPMPDGEISATDITYGQTLADSKITGKMKDGNKEVTGTFAWKDGTIKPNAGSYEAEWTFTPDASNGGIYANATGKVSVKVNPKDIKGATVTLKSDSFEYDGTRKDPEVASVVLDGETLVYGQYNDYGYHYDMASDVGTYNLVVGGNHNYTGSVSVTWSITPKTVTPTIEVASCSYTGDTLTPDVTLTDDIGNTIDPKEYTVSYSNNTNAGTGTVTIKDAAGGNYVLNEASTTFTITKAAAPTLEDIVISHKYTVTTGEKTIGSTMPVDAGALSFTKGTESTTGSVTVSSWAVDAATGKVTYTLSSGTAGDTVTLPVTISSTNYADTVINVVITLTRRDDQAALVITGADAVIYGEKLILTTTGGSGTGAVTYRIDTAYSTGEATIDPETGVLTPVKVGSVSVIATKAGDKDYNDVTSAPFVLMIKPASPTGEPKYTEITTSGKTLKDAVLTTEGSTLSPKDGKLEWVDDEGDVLPGDTWVEANKTYKWRFTPTDTNYTTMTGEIELYHKSSSGGGSGSNSGSYTITVKDAQNGDVTTDRKSASAGTTVTITVKPDSGYVLDDLTVTDSKGNDIKLTGKGGGKYTFTMPSGKATVEASFTPAKSENPFTDVPSGAYYEDAVAWAVNNGITGGTSATTFAPDGFCTRAQAVTFLWRAAGSPAPKSTAMAFTDVPAGSYYYDAVLWAIENGVTKGTSDTTFSPNANCSRGQIVTFLWRSQKSPDAAAANPFTDVAANAYYTSAVLWAVEKSITGGTSATTFSPSANCTRAQIVTFIYS